MYLRRNLMALLLCLLALTLCFSCAGPSSSPPPPNAAVEPPPPLPPPIYYVNVSSLALREGPTTSASMITTLSFNDQVELIGTSHGWGNVRDLRRNFVGWAALKYLQPSPADRPRPVPSRHRAPAAPKKEEPAPPPVPKAM